MSDQLFDFAELYLATPYTAGETTLDLYAKNDVYKLTDQKTAALITEFFCAAIDRDDDTKFMGIKISDLEENGTFQGKTRYTATIATSDGANPMVALANTYDGTTADANIIADNQLDSLQADSLVLCTVGSGILRQLLTAFASSTTSETIVSGSGEAFAVREQLSLHTDGKYYKFDSATYPNWAGTAGTAATGVGESFTLRKGGYRVPGYAGLTIGGDVFTDDGGTTVQTATSTSKFIGKAFSATELDLINTAPPTSEASKAEAEAGAILGKYNSPLRTAQQLAASGFADIGDIKMVETTGTGVRSIAARQALGWAICDGTTPASQSISSPVRDEATPDMVDKFVRGHASASGGSGGSDTDSITLSVANLAAHTHGTSQQIGPTGGAQTAIDRQSGISSSEFVTDSAGSGTPFNVDTIPAYYEVVYMIKVK